MYKQFDFYGQNGQLLSGRFEIPIGQLKAIAIFAHCFTCSKNVKAATAISSSLAEKGIGVLRFDFTGLGNSEGDFQNTNFSSNVEDIVYAFNALKKQHKAPEILIGHSFGGAAVLKAATLLQEITSVVTIAAPSCTSHVAHLFKDNLEQIKKQERSEVDLSGRKFTITNQFVKDINETDILTGVSTFKKALLVMHSPTDNIVSINHAADIFKAAKHPKSFISLDSADHLISKQIDSDYISEVISSWASRYISDNNPIVSKEDTVPNQVVVRSTPGKKFRNSIYVGPHNIIVDEPVSYGGNNEGMTPYQLLSAALGGCTSMTINSYAERKEISLDSIEVRLSHKKVDDAGITKDHITKEILITGANLTTEQKMRLYEIAEKCPVNRTLKSEVIIETKHN